MDRVSLHLLRFIVADNPIQAAHDKQHAGYIMNGTIQAAADTQKARGLRGYQLFLIVMAAVFVAILGAAVLIKIYLFPSQFKPVELSVSEERVLNEKLERLDFAGTSAGSTVPMQSSPQSEASEFDADGRLIPERYSEQGARREITLSERELNALLAKNTDLARRLAIDLSDNLMSAKLLLPVDEDFPVLGGQILKVRAGVELAYDQGRPVVMLKGISVMGVPIPNAWLGGIKNIDLVREYGGESGFWQSFADGVEFLHVEDGNLRIKLKE